MHDLNTIKRLNFEAFAASIKSYTDQGRIVVAKYDGLHLVAIETFPGDQFGQADATGQAYNATSPSHRSAIHLPTPPELVVGKRDQSEDRAFAATAGAGVDRTLAGYVARKA